jgi:hypothetical protein
VLAISAPALATTNHMSVRHAVSVSAGTCTGWEAYPAAASTCSVIPGTTQTSAASLQAPTATTATTTTDAPTATFAVAPDAYGSNDKGCSGFYLGSGEMGCVGSADSHTGYLIVLRNGTYSQSQGGSNGFGYAKAHIYHNLDQKPLLDAIAMGGINGPPNAKEYQVAYYYNSQAQIVVTVVADTQDISYKGNDTPDGKELGVLTAFCSPPGSTSEDPCPDAVNSTL